MVENINNSEVNVILNTVMGNDKGIDDIQKQLEKQLELAIKNGSVKGFKDSKKSIARINVGKDWYIASFGVTRDGKYDKRTKVQYSRPLSLQDSKEIYQSRTYRDYQNRLTTKFAEQESKRLSRLERKKQIKERQNIELEKIEEKKQDDRAKKLQFAETWTKIIGGSELDIKKAKLRSLREQLIEIGDDGSDAFQQISKEAENLSVEINKLEKSLKPSGFQRLLNTIKRVGFYRIARNLFRLIENGFKQGLNFLADASPQINKILSSIVSQFDKINASIAIIFVPILKVIEPILNAVADAISNIANKISYLNAVLSGSSEYWKVNLNYIKEYNKQNSNLSFDKFESLNLQDNPMEKELVSDGILDKLSNLATLIQSILTTILAISISKFIMWIINGGLSGLFTGLSSFMTKMYPVFTLVAAIYDIYKIIENIIDLIQNWSSKSLGEKIKSIMKILIYGLATAVLLKGYLTGNVMQMAMGIGATAVIGTLDSIGLFANGGLVDSGSLFIAGESGAELVTTMPSGQTGVTNVAQFKQAMLEALYDWSSTNTESGGDIVLNLDGAEIARSKRFTKEMNIRNASLNLR